MTNFNIQKERTVMCVKTDSVNNVCCALVTVEESYNNQTRCNVSTYKGLSACCEDTMLNTDCSAKCNLTYIIRNCFYFKSTKVN